MVELVRCNLSHQNNCFYRCFLCLFWVLGFLLGADNSSLFYDLNSLMRGGLLCSVSIVSLLTVSFLPFLFSAFVVAIGLRWLLYPICFLKAFCCSFACTAIHVAFGSAGWLMCFLLAFSDLLTMPMLFLYWLRHISDLRFFSGTECVFFLSIYTLIGCIDYYYVAPLVTMV